MIGTPTTCSGCGTPMHSCAFPAWCSEECRKRHEEQRRKTEEAILKEIEKNKPPKPIDYQI